VTLCDAGPLFALIDPRQGELHDRCKRVLPSLPSPLVTTWPSFTEAMYLAYRSGGWPMQNLLWKFVSGSALLLSDLGAGETERMRVLMEQYRDTPMDLADASLVAVAETLDQTRIFTLDHHFRAYRLEGTKPFDVVPA
jgi:predicted nucleic acid-binding protein